MSWFKKLKSGLAQAQPFIALAGRFGVPQASSIGEITAAIIKDPARPDQHAIQATAESLDVLAQQVVALMAELATMKKAPTAGAK